MYSCGEHPAVRCTCNSGHVCSAHDHLVCNTSPGLHIPCYKIADDLMNTTIITVTLRMTLPTFVVGRMAEQEAMLTQHRRHRLLTSVLPSGCTRHVLQKAAFQQPFITDSTGEHDGRLCTHMRDPSTQLVLSKTTLARAWHVAVLIYTLQYDNMV